MTRQRRPRDAATTRGERHGRRAPALRLLLPAAIGAAALLLVLGFAFRGEGGDPGGEGPGPHERDVALAQPVADRPPAPSLAVQTASFGDGSTFDLAAERGNVVVMYFMAYWCTTCIPEARALADLHELYAADGVRILVLDVDQRSSEQLLADFRERAGGGRHLWAIDRDLAVARTLKVQILDATVVVDRDGRIAYRDGFSTPRETLLAVLEALR